MSLELARRALYQVSDLRRRLAFDFDSGTYTPVLLNMAIGTGGSPDNTATYRYANGLLSVWGHIDFGTTGATLPGASTEAIGFPPGYTSDLPLAGMVIGMVRMNIGGDDFMGPLLGGTGSEATLRSFHLINSIWIDTNPIGATSPATWAGDDWITYHFTVPVTRD